MEELTASEQAQLNEYQAADAQPNATPDVPEQADNAGQPQEEPVVSAQPDQPDQPEVQADEETLDEADGDGKKQNQVPVKVLQETRGKFKAQKAQLEEALQAERMRSAQMEEQLVQILQAIQQPQNPLPKVEEDPLAVIGYTAQSVQELKRGLEEKARVLESLQQDYIARQERERISSEANRAVSRFDQARRANPEFDNAANFIYDQMYRQAKIVDPDLDEATFQRGVAEELIQVQRELDRRGGDIADYIFNIAKARGYVGNTQAINGAKASKTLTSSNGNNVNAGIDIENMTEAELLALPEEEILKALRY